MQEKLSQSLILGRIIRLNREAAGVSISVLSQCANLPVETLEKIETGQCETYASDLVAIANVLGLDAGLLIEIEGRAKGHKKVHCFTVPNCGDNRLIVS